MQAELHEGYRAGCIGRIAQLHATYYAATHGFGVAFEAKVARELADFCSYYQPGRDGLWLVEQGGNVEGSVIIDGSHADTDHAHLRWFITSDAIKGQGMGRRLLQQAMDFVDACGYRSTQLWTFAGLDAARHLYESYGFELVHQSPGNQWGSVVTEQQFVRRNPR
jgi:GNAT superfamily N-acetyltransferase